MSLDKVIQDIKKRYGEGAIFRLGDLPDPSVGAISTGSLVLDLAVGIGGLPRGRITEVYGPESSGKTTLCQHVVAEAQRLGGHCAFVDMEHALDPVYAAACGVDVEKLYISQPSTAEEALAIVESLVESNAMDVIVVDSVAALVPRAEIESDMGSAHVGLQARLMSQAMRKLTGLLKKSNCVLIFTNQLRMKIGIVYGNPEVTSGGNALKYYAAVRLDMRPKVEKSGGEAVASVVKVRVKKNKVAPPFREAEIYLAFGQGFVKEFELLQLGVEYDLIKKTGAYYQFHPEEPRVHGKDVAIQHLKDRPDLAGKLELDIRERAKL